MGQKEGTKIALLGLKGQGLDTGRDTEPEAE